MTALFIGRFQPFHRGHLDAIKSILKKHPFVIIAIGSSEQNFLPENPFTAGERIEMIHSALVEEKIPAEKYMIIPITNINNYALWPAYVDLLTPSFDTVCTGSKITEYLYKNYNKIRKSPYKIEKISKNLAVSSTRIREKILKNKNWEKDLPKSVIKLMKKWNAGERLRIIQEKEK